MPATSQASTRMSVRMHSALLPWAMSRWLGGAIEYTADPAGIDESLAHRFDDILAIGLDQVVFFEVNQVVILDSTGEGHAQAAHNVDLFAAGQLECPASGYGKHSR